MSYKEIIKKFKPTVSDNTINQYNFTLNKIGKLIGASPEDIKPFKNLDKVREAIEHLSDNTKKNYLSNIIVLLKAKKTAEEVIKKFDTERQKYVDIYEDGLSNGTKSEKQTANWADFEEIEKVRLSIKKEVHNAKIKTKVQNGKITPADRKLYQDYLLISLYTLLPPVRLDYGDMENISKTEYDDLGEKKEFHNYLVMDKKSAFFSMNEYKTSHKYGEKKIDIPPELLRIIKSYMRINKTGFLLIDNRNKQLGANGITKHLTRIFKNKLGKSISASMLRHIYLTTKYKDVQAEMAKDADIMGHDTKTQKGYVKK